MAVVAPAAAPPRWAEVMLDLVTCVCEELTVTGAGEPCWCGMWPGLELSWEYCGECSGDRCGMGWVRMVQVFPYSTFPIQDFALGCDLPLAWQVEVGALRCVPVPADGEVMDPLTSSDVALAQMADSFALWRALKCCTASDVALGLYQPVGPQGGCVGGFWTAFIAFD